MASTDGLSGQAAADVYWKGSIRVPIPRISAGLSVAGINANIDIGARDVDLEAELSFQMELDSRDVFDVAKVLDKAGDAFDKLSAKVRSLLFLGCLLPYSTFH